MATTPNYGWVTPAPTDFVTDLPADFETFADAVDVDLAGLLGGTTGQVLTKASGTDHDFAFAAVPAPTPPAFTLLNTGNTALPTGASSLTISSLDHDTLLIIVEGAAAPSAPETFRIRFNSDTASNYAQFGALRTAGASYAPGDTTRVTGTDSRINFGNTSSNTGATCAGGLMVFTAKSTDVKPYILDSGSDIGGGGASGNQNRNNIGFYSGTSAISSVTILTGSGGVFSASGNMYVYGA
jgi:hypothetical protein